jgi:murein DD-endopeptidase MepM/ murein hydrolase activator NlpD
LASVFVFVLASPARGAVTPAKPGDEKPEVTSQKGDHGATVYGTNPFDFPVTITVELTTQDNLRANKPMPATIVIPPKKEKMPLVQLMQADRNKGWRYAHTFSWTAGAAGAKHDDKTVYTLPFEPGHSYRCTFAYDESNATVFALPEGEKICAARDGKVVRVVEHHTDGGEGGGAKENVNHVYVLHKDQTIGRYASFKTDGVDVSVGKQVKAGDVLGTAGASGAAKNAYVRFEIISATDGKTRTTFPARFATAEGEAVMPAKDQRYQRPFADQKPGEKRAAANTVQAVVTCKEVKDHEPVGVTDTFTAADKLVVHVSLGAPGAKSVRVEFAAAGKPLPALKKDLNPKETATKVYASVELAKAPELRGDCTATVFVDEKELASAKFKVK